MSELNLTEVVVAADNDGREANIKSSALISEAFSSLNKQYSHLKIRIVYPPSLEGREKSDWNDILKEEGLNELQNSLLQQR